MPTPLRGQLKPLEDLGVWEYSGGVWIYPRGYKVITLLKIIRPSDKLDLKISLFRIKRNICDINFEFELPLIIRIYSVFHILLLEPAHPDTFKSSIPELNPEIQKLVYNVKKILAVRKRRNKLQ